jgi:IS605 OrfB family transposase
MQKLIHGLSFFQNLRNWKLPRMYDLCEMNFRHYIRFYANRIWMKWSLKFSLNNGNRSKLESMDALYDIYVTLVNHYLHLLPQRNATILRKEEVQAADPHLSARYKQCAARQAMMIWKVWRRTWQRGCQLPVFSGAMQLDQRFLEVEAGENSFDYWIKMSTPTKGKCVHIPFRSYDYANHYFKHWKLRKGGKLQKIGVHWFLNLCFETPTPPLRETGDVKGIDIGYRKLIAPSDGNFLGREIPRLAEKIARKQAGSKRWKRATTEMQHYVNHVVKQLFTLTFRVIMREQLQNLKRNKRGLWSRRVNRLFLFWLYSHLIHRIYELCALHGVRVVVVNAAYTSQTCLACGIHGSLNRRDKAFSYVYCGFAADADYVGALNVWSRFAEQPIVAQVGAS